MSTPYLGEIKLVPYNFAPVGWAFCAGQLLSIAEFDALFSLIGTIYGGDGQNTFGLPDLRGRAAMHQSNSFPIGSLIGTEAVTLTSQQLPAHGHQLHVSSGVSDKITPVGFHLGKSATTNVYGSSGDVVMSTSGVVGGNQSHDNRQPYLVLNYVIALEGVYPQQN